MRVFKAVIPCFVGFVSLYWSVLARLTHAAVGGKCTKIKLLKLFVFFGLTVRALGPKTPLVETTTASGQTGVAELLRRSPTQAFGLWDWALFFEIVVCYGRDAQAAVLG